MTEVQLGALFAPAGAERSDGWVPAPHCDGPWAEGSLHGGAVAALVVTEAERGHDPSQWRTSSLSAAIVRPVTRAQPIVPTVRLLREGRRILLVEVQLHAGGALVTHATVLLQARVPGLVEPTDPEVPARVPPPDLPEQARPAEGMSSWVSGRPTFMLDAHTLVSADGRFPGTSAWFHLGCDVLPGVAPSPMARAAAAADHTNGLTAPARLGFPPARGFVNADLHVELSRDPVGRWVRLEGAQRWEPDGTGHTDGVLHDVEGQIGTCLQHLVIS